MSKQVKKPKEKSSASNEAKDSTPKSSAGKKSTTVDKKEGSKPNKK